MTTTAAKAGIEFEEAQAKIKALVDDEQAAVDAAVEQEFGGTRPLTDVEERWVRMKHPEMSKEELDALIADGLPADVEPITRADLPAAVHDDPHWWKPGDWDARRRARKVTKASKRRNRPVKHRSKKQKAKRR